MSTKVSKQESKDLLLNVNQRSIQDSKNVLLNQRHEKLNVNQRAQTG